MPSKKDLAAFKKPSLKTVLAENTSGPEKPITQSPVRAKPPQTPKGRAGRKPKPPSEKESEMVGLMLTPAEKKNLQEKAGLVKLGTFIKHHLRTETDLLK